MTRFRPHIGPLALFATLAVAWTWPLVLHLGTAVPGAPGDNFSFLWVDWWMRHALATPGGAFFRTEYLFYPFGTSLVDHSNTALPAWIAATVMGRLSIVTAQNVLVLANLFLNGALAYGGAWQLTGHRRAAVMAGVLFGMSPYVAAHLPGHFELIAAWVLPAFAMAVHGALTRRSTVAAIAAGLVIAMTAYIAYYYVVYAWLLFFVYLWVWARPLAIVSRPRINPSARVPIRGILLAIAAAAVAGAAWVLITGGAVLRIGGLAISLRRPQNLLTLMWLCLVVRWWLGRHIRLRLVRHDDHRPRRALSLAAIVGGVFVLGTMPLMHAAFQLMAQGEYVSQTYFWQSAPQGIDALAPLVGHPFHSVFGGMASRAYAAMHADRVEAVAWLGLVPVLILAAGRVSPGDRDEARRWWIVAGVFAIWAIGPMLRVGGADIGLWMPEALARYIPVVSNARMPGRAMVVVYLALAMLIAMRLAAAADRWQRPARQWLLIGAVAFEYADMPIAVTPLDQPPALVRLAAAPAGAVCNVPFALGDGLGRIGAGDYRVMYDATIHGHPIVGGFVSRMPPGAAERYAAMPVVGDLLRMSGGGTIVPAPMPAGTPSPCTYLVVKRSSATAEQLRYVENGPFEKIDGDDSHEIYVVRR